MINNRQAGRRRGRGGNGQNGQNGQRQGGNPGRPDNGNRIDSRARGNASQLYEKYKSLASDAQRQGDRVNTEYYLQFADHYFRVLSEQRGRFEEQPRRGRDDFDMDGDEEYGDEGEPMRANEQSEAIRDESQRDGNRDDRPRADRPREGNRDARDGNRDARDESRDQRESQRPTRAAAEWEPRAERTDRDTRRPRADHQQPTEIAGQRRADPPVAGESLEARADAVLEADAPLPRRRGRPRRVEVEVEAEQGSDGAVFEADRLPPSLTAPANDADDTRDAANDSGEAKPRRRRRSPTAEVPAAE